MTSISTFILSWMIITDVVHGILLMIAIKYILDAFHYISNDPTMQHQAAPPGLDGGGGGSRIPKAQLFMQKLRWITVLLLFLRILFITICGFKDGQLYYESPHSTSTNEFIFDLFYWLLEECTAEGRFIIIMIIFLRMTEILMQLYNIEFNGRLMPELRSNSKSNSKVNSNSSKSSCFGGLFFGARNEANNNLKRDMFYKQNDSLSAKDEYYEIANKLKLLNIIKIASIIAIFLDGIQRIIDGILWLTDNQYVHILWQEALAVVIHVLFYIAFVTFVLCTCVVYFKANQHYANMRALSDLQDSMKEAQKQIDEMNDDNDNDNEDASEMNELQSSMNSKMTQQTGATVNTRITHPSTMVTSAYSINNNNNNNDNNMNNKNKVNDTNAFILSQLPKPINIQLLAKEDKKRQIRETIVRLRRVSPLFLLWCVFYIYYDSMDVYHRWYVGDDVENDDYKLLFKINLYWIYWGVCDTILFMAIVYYLKPIETTHMRIQEQIRLHTLKVHKAIMNARQMEIDAKMRGDFNNNYDINNYNEHNNNHNNMNAPLIGGGNNMDGDMDGGGYEPPNIVTTKYNNNENNHHNNNKKKGSNELKGVVNNVANFEEATVTATSMTDSDDSEYTGSSDDYTHTASQSGY